MDNKRSKPMGDTEFEVIEPSGLLDFLLLKLTNKSRNNVKSMLAYREVLVDGYTVTRYDFPLQPGQTVRIVRSVTREPHQRDTLQILYEDADLIAVSKPSGMLTVSAGDDGVTTVYRELTDYARRIDPNGRIFIVHRLDRDTSGVLLFAKNEKMKFALQDSWSELVSQRAYVAIVEGRLSKKSGKIQSWLKETKTLMMYSSDTEGDGLKAITNYRVIAETRHHSLLDIRLETGRKNQIRVHMKELGHPVVGDKKYGAKRDPLKRLCLHAYRLELTHPFTGKPLRFDAELPAAFNTLMNGK
ncbi:MAG: RluA family pseudouridine synthase, partial [Oscillospiraceae bacterium]